MSKIQAQESVTDNKKVLSNMPVSTESSSNTPPDSQKNSRIPKRVLYFSDGTIEEYSSNEEEVDSSENIANKQVLQANIGGLTWAPWFWYQTVYVGSRALGVCDYLGETLANFFGIITPKYEYEIEHYKRVMAEEEEKKKEDIECGGWTGETSQTVTTEEPQRYIRKDKGTSMA